MSGPVFTVEMLAGGNGDALWIEYGDPDRPFRIMVDGGTEPTRTTLAARFGALPEDQRHVELLIVTHIDGDHIGGILDFLEKQMVPVTFGDVWFNGYRHLPSASRYRRRFRCSVPTVLSSVLVRTSFSRQPDGRRRANSRSTDSSTISATPRAIRRPTSRTRCSSSPSSSSSARRRQRSDTASVMIAATRGW